MSKYMLIASSDIKIPILATPKKPYVIKFGSKEMKMYPWFEAHMATVTFSRFAKTEVSEQLRFNFKFTNSIEIDEFIRKFKEDHPSEPHKFSLAEMPTLTEEGETIEMNIGTLDNAITLTHEDELHILDIIVNDEQGAKAVELWFKRYCWDYAVHTKYKRDSGYAGEIAADGFCVAHGLNPYEIRAYRPHPPVRELTAKEKIKEKLKEFALSLFAIAVLFLIGSIPFAFFSLAEAFNDDFLLSAAFICIGFSLLSIMIYLVFRRKK